MLYQIITTKTIICRFDVVIERVLPANVQIPNISFGTILFFLFRKGELNVLAMGNFF